MHTRGADIVSHNMNYLNKVLVSEKEYFDHILEAIDPIIKLDKSASCWFLMK